MSIRVTTVACVAPIDMHSDFSGRVYGFVSSARQVLPKWNRVVQWLANGRKSCFSVCVSFKEMFFRHTWHGGAKSIDPTMIGLIDAYAC